MLKYRNFRFNKVLLQQQTFNFEQENFLLKISYFFISIYQKLKLSSFYDLNRVFP